MAEEIGPRSGPHEETPFDRPILEERYPAVVTYITAFGEKGNRLYVSRQIETMLGFSAEEWLGGIQASYSGNFIQRIENACWQE